MRLNVTFAIAPIMMMLCATASGQNYPTHEIRVICGLPAGSGGDIVTRFYADQLSKLAGKPVIVENRAGMIMSAGAEAVAKAPPDGYTILITSVTSSHAANVFNFTKLPLPPLPCCNSRISS
jgi:tripartite-type tricarboxylate transporter receptor subunit TctC